MEEQKYTLYVKNNRNNKYQALLTRNTLEKVYDALRRLKEQSMLPHCKHSTWFGRTTSNQPYNFDDYKIRHIVNIVETKKVKDEWL